MKRFGSGLLLAISLIGCSGQNRDDVRIELPAGETVSGSAFLQPETLKLQNDDFANPAQLWVDRGRALFSEPAANGSSCAACHSSENRSLAGAATRYPAIDQVTQRLVNLEGRIGLCRQRYQDLPALDYESDHALALTSYVASLSNGMAIDVTIGAEEITYLETGKDYFFQRRGQLNLSCHGCHDLNWGKKLRGDTISQGHGNGFPAYRFEWESVGSLHRRLQDCDTGVRAEPYPLGSDEYVALELYLAVRANGLEIETPAVRR